MSASIRESYNLKKLTKFNNIDQKYNNDDIKNLIIKPVKIEKQNINIDSLVNNRIEESKKELEESYSKRVNQPYKGIIKDFDFNKKINNEKDLIIHKVTNEDKVHFKEDMSSYQNIISKQNTELGSIYSKDNKIKHKKDFEYQHKYKYRSKLDSEEDVNLRSDRIEFYKKEQNKLEDSKKKIDDILLNLIESGVLSENLDTINYDKIDANELENTLKKEFGDSEYERLMKELMN